MLTKSHLAMIRAALQYFDEELGPHGMDIMWPYFDEEPTVTWTSPKIRELRAFLRDCDLRYAVHSAESDQLTGVALSHSRGDIPLAARPTQRVVTVVLPPSA